MSDPVAWLGSRRPGPPASLLDGMRRAVEQTEPRDRKLPALLAAAGLSTLEGVAAGPGDRAAAARLLAADALLTAACEAAAEEGPESLASVLELLSPARFEALLERGATP